MFDYFWDYKTDLPAGVGTPNFGTTHIIWLSIVLLLMVSIILICRKQSDAIRLRLQKIFIITAATLEISRWVWAAVIGHYTIVEMLPLHLCSLSIWVIMLAVFTKNSFLKNFSYALCMPGALAALLTPDWGVYPFFSFQYLHSVIVHSLLLLIPALWVWSDEFRPDYRQLPKCFTMLLAFAVPVYGLNQLIGSNYLFLREAPVDTPLELFETWCGNPGYLLPLFCLILFIWLLLYLPWIIMEVVDKNKKIDPEVV